MSARDLAEAARTLTIVQDVAKGILTEADAAQALRSGAVVRAAPVPPAREPGADEGEDVAVVSMVGAIEVPLFLATDRGPVDVGAQETKRRIAQALADARDTNGSPIVYMTAGGLARLSVNDDGDPVICHIADGHDMRILIDQYLVCGWPKAAKGGPVVVWSNDFPGARERFIELTRPAAWFGVGVRLPTLDTVRSFPFFDASFKLVNRPGYHAETRTYLDRETAITRPAPGETPATVMAEWLSDFMAQTFAGPHDFTYAVAALLTILMRPGIQGPVPMFAIIAAMPRTGKGKLAKSICLAAMGRTAKGLPLSADSDRQIAEILSALRAGHPVRVIDNVRNEGKPFGGQAIESALTEPTFDGRLLGGNQDVSYKVASVFMLTANNPTFTKDMSERVVPVTLTSRTAENAAARSGWTHRDIDAPGGWTMRHRSRILGAAVAMVEGWQARVAEGETFPVWRPGGFDAWAEAVGATCVAAGLPDWGGGIANFLAATEPETAAYKALARIIADFVVATGRRMPCYLYAEDVTAMVSQVDFWRFQEKGDTVTAKKAWDVLRHAKGRMWSVKARKGEDGQIVRAAGVVKLESVGMRSGRTAAGITWTEQE